jgi:hypothetical protein
MLTKEQQAMQREEIRRTWGLEVGGQRGLRARGSQPAALTPSISLFSVYFRPPQFSHFEPT